MSITFIIYQAWGFAECDLPVFFVSELGTLMGIKGLRSLWVVSTIRDLDWRISLGILESFGEVFSHWYRPVLLTPFYSWF
jgi:hypothetical protein